MKLIVDENSQKVIGAHMIGPDSAEIIQGIAIAIKAGALKSDFDIFYKLSFIVLTKYDNFFGLLC